MTWSILFLRRLNRGCSSSAPSTHRRHTQNVIHSQSRSNSQYTHWRVCMRSCSVQGATAIHLWLNLQGASPPRSTNGQMYRLKKRSCSEVLRGSCVLIKFYGRIILLVKSPDSQMTLRASWWATTQQWLSLTSQWSWRASHHTTSQEPRHHWEQLTVSFGTTVMSASWNLDCNFSESCCNAVKYKPVASCALCGFDSWGEKKKQTVQNTLTSVPDSLLLNAHCWWIKQIVAFLCFAANNYYLVINLLIISWIIDISIRCQKILKNCQF